MGLLEKAKQRKVSVDNKVIKKNENAEVTKLIGLFEKAKQRKQEITEKKTDEPIKKKIYEGLRDQDKKIKEVIDEKTGFGWNGLGSRRIVFDYNINEYIYEVSEPVLNDEEIEIKDELSRLFKMLADVNISNMSKPEKEKYLEETLEQIIIDNDINFTKRKKKNKEKDENVKKKSLKELFSIKKNKEKDENIKSTKKDKKVKKKSLKKLFFIKKKEETDENNKLSKKR